MKKKEKESENSGRITGDTQARMLPSFPAEIKPESGWQVQRSRSSFVRPSTPPCLQSKCSSGGGCVKYYDPSPLSPASVAS